MGDTRVIVIIDMGCGVMGWVVVVVLLMQMVGSWVRSWSQSSHRRHKWWGHGCRHHVIDAGGGVVVVVVVMVVVVVGCQRGW